MSTLYNVDIKLIPFDICLIHTPAYRFRFITLEKYFYNTYKVDTSYSNHLPKLTVLVVVAFTKKEKRDTQAKKRQGSKQSKHTTF